MKKNLFKVFLVIFLVLMFAAPYSTLKGAENGLLLWFNTILPTLLPFIILSNIIIVLDITDYICFLFRPVLKRIFQVSNDGCYPIIMGLLSGFPIGAKSTADLVKAKKITQEEGQFLVPLCNNASITFITSYIVISCLKQPDKQFIVLGIIYLSAIISSVICRLLNYKKFAQSNHIKTSNHHTPIITTQNKPKPSFFELIDEAILDGFEVITKIGGYIILFSIAAQIIIDMLPALPLLKILFVGSLEITTGIHIVASSALSQGIKLILMTTIAALGGLSGLAQTQSVLSGSGLSLSYYIKTKILNAAVAFILSFLYVNFIMH